MDLSINGENVTVEVSSEVSVSLLLLILRVPDPEFTAVELNGMLLESDMLDTVKVRDGDSLELLPYMGGG